MQSAPKRPRSVTRWYTPENPTGEPGRAGLENRGAKGRPFVRVPAGARVELMDVTGSGTVRRIWLTLSDLSAEVLRGMCLEAFWDGADSPAVSVPLGEFFGAALGRVVAGESAVFASPEGRSLCLTLPMPFRESARLVLTNDSPRPVQRLFYEVDATLGDEHDDDLLYLHAGWRREARVGMGEPFAIVPRVHGAGCFVGMQLGVVTDPGYGSLWWGEGEVRMRIDGDGQAKDRVTAEAGGHTLSGTGLEDHVGTGWGMGAFAHRTQGCPVADADAGLWTPYRFHLDDPVWFNESIEVTVDAMGGGKTHEVLAAARAGAELLPVTIDVEHQGLVRLLDGSSDVDVRDPRFADEWLNFFRRDDYAATSWLYLDSPHQALTPLAPAVERLEGLPRADA